MGRKAVTKKCCFFIAIAILAMLLLTGCAATINPTIDVLHAEGVIDPVLADYIRRGIEHAEENNAVACIIELDASGDSDTAMHDIVKDIVNARVPVIVYVSPSGARATSVGVFITLAAHVAAMAPNTAIGAASPVSMGPEGEQEISETQEKILNEAAAYIRSIAKAQGRNMEWVEKAVRENISATEQEALKLSVIDMVAPDLDTLISQLNGREVTMLDGTVVTLNTQGITFNHIDMNAVEE